MHPLQCISGRGYHFVWKIPVHSDTFAALDKIGRVTIPHLYSYYTSRRSPHGNTIDESMARAYTALGMLLEYCAQRFRNNSAGESKIPVEITAVKVGKGERGREIVSIDISEYSDPLSARVIRIPFSLYLKPWLRFGIIHHDIASKIPLIVMIPMESDSFKEAITISRDLQKAQQRSYTTPCRIPDLSTQTMELVEEYTHSRSAQFHRYFYSVGHEPPERWKESYDHFDRNSLPWCAAHILKNPNDLLKKPAAIEMVVRVLLAEKWHPRHIAGLLRSIYERDFNWGAHWYHYDAATRADFFTRVFSGLWATGIDRLVDFNCVSTQEKNLCFKKNGSCGIDRLRERLLKEKWYV
jgi:hypothetical protein